MLKRKQNGLKKATAILMTAAMMAGSLMNGRGRERLCSSPG